MSSLARIEELEKKFAESPRRFFAPLANEYRKAGDPARAIELCRAHLEQQPNHMSGQVVLGQALFDAGFKDEARGAFELALSLDPENLIALRHLGDMAKESSDFGSARKWYSQLLDVDSRNHDVMVLMREVDELISAGSFATARIDAHAAVEEDAPPEPAAAAEITSVESAPESHTPDVQIPAAIEAAAESAAEIPAAPLLDLGDVALPATEAAVVDESPEPVEETVPEPVADFWSAEEIIAFETEPAAASSDDPFLWHEPHDAAGVEPAVGHGGAPEINEALVTFSGPSRSVDDSALTSDNATSEAHAEHAASIREELAAEVEVVIESVDPAAESRSDYQEVFHQPVAEAGSDSASDALQARAAQPLDQVHTDLGGDSGTLDVAATHMVPDDEVDDALQWEMQMLSSEMSTSGDTLPNEWVPDFDVADDAEEIEAQREVAARLDWPDSTRAAADSGATDMSDMDIVDSGGHDESAEDSAPAPAVFITETMAQLYEQQGYPEMAAAVYRQILEKNPDNQRLRERIADLDQRILGRTDSPARPRSTAAAEEGDSARDFFSALVRVPLRPRLARPYVAFRGEGDQEAGGGSIADSGAPAREASNALSLESVFRNGGGGRGITGGPAGFSFDQFFVGGGHAPPSGGTPEREQRATRQKRGQDSEEIEQFNNWLEGLKRS